MQKKHTTTRTTTNGEKVKVYIDSKGNIYITVIGPDNFTIVKDIVIDYKGDN